MRILDPDVTGKKRTNMRIVTTVVSIVWGAFIAVGAAAEVPDLSVKVGPRVTVARPVSPLLLGGVVELAIGRTENILAEKLYDRGFELPEKFTFNRDWCVFAKEKPELEDWWHSGYEEASLVLDPERRG